MSIILHRTPIPLDIFFGNLLDLFFPVEMTVYENAKVLNTFLSINWRTIYINGQGIAYLFWWGWNITKCVLVTLRDSLLVRSHRLISLSSRLTFRWRCCKSLWVWNRLESSANKWKSKTDEQLLNILSKHKFKASIHRQLLDILLFEDDYIDTLTITSRFKQPLSLWYFPLRLI